MSEEPFNFNKLDRPGRPTNRTICNEFRALLTSGFSFDDINIAVDPGLMSVKVTREEMLAATKDWRNQLWRAFREIEDRLDPIGAMDREKRNAKPQE